MLSLRRYTIAVLFTLLALSVGLAGAATWGVAATYSLFLGAVMLSSWISGLGPGLLSTILGTLAADYFLIEPVHVLTIDASRAVQLAAFVAIAILISSLNDARRRALDALSAERAQLERRVRERTAELATANDELRTEVERRSRSERNFRGLIEAAPDAILVIDANGCIVTINHEAERMFGYARGALLGRDVEIIVPDRFKEAHRTKRQRYGEAPSPRAISGDLVARRADGTEVPVEIRVSPLEAEGQLTVVGIVRDVTERQRAQMIQQHLLHDLGERVKEVTALHAVGRLLNEPGRPADLLPRIVERLPSAWQYPEVAGARIAVAGLDVRTSGFESTPWIQRVEFSTSAGTGSIEVAYRVPRPPAAEGPFLAEERNLLESIAGMLRAYFERLQVEEHRLALARSEAGRDEAQAANAAKDRFLASLSHELRSPLNVMRGWIEILRSSPQNVERVTKGLDVLNRSVQLQSNLIEDLLDVSRIVAGKLRIDRRRIDIAVVTSNAVEAARPVARDRHVDLTTDIAPSLWVEADPQRLHQVVSNLLTNALKFTPEHGSVHVRLEPIDGHARIAVRDTGIGISGELLPRIFERFEQGDHTTNRRHTGLGLGLAIAKHLVEQQGGRIAAASDGVGCGSTFTVTLPLTSGAGVAAAPVTTSSVDRSRLAGVRVLVVNDDADTRAALRTVLEAFGTHPTLVATAREALALVHDNPPDVLLSDMAIPDEDGCSLLRRIRAGIDAAHLPAAALSARSDTETRARAADAGFQETLTKPVDPALLAQTLARLVHRGGESLQP